MIGTKSADVRVYFDASRLLSRANATPTGIDRVDLAYVKALSGMPGFDLRLITFDAFGPRLLRRQQTKNLINARTQRWQAGAGATPDDGAGPAFQRLSQWLQSPAGTPRPAAETRVRRPMSGDSSGLFLAALGSSRDAVLSERVHGRPQSVPAVYLNTSHGRLFRKAVSRWLRATQIGAVFFVHDLIPIEFPQFNRAQEPVRHAARLETVSAYAHHVLVNSEATRSALVSYLGGRQRRVPPVSVLPLGVESRFSHADGLADLRPSVPYFVVLGTIEPRKNHQLLLQVWRNWIEAGEATVPRLVVLGRRGWENDSVFNILDRSTLLSGHVAECSGLGDAEVSALLRGARALLCPSFAEGYSLPVAEALASGTPVIASAIAVHREVGGPYAEYLHPADAAAWQLALKDYAAEPSPRRDGRLARLRESRPPDWNVHFMQAAAVLRDAAHYP